MTGLRGRWAELTDAIPQVDPRDSKQDGLESRSKGRKELLLTWGSAEAENGGGATDIRKFNRS